MGSAPPLVLRAPSGILEVWHPAPGVVVDRCVGRATVEFARALADQIEIAIATGPRPYVFGDWEAVEGYESAARVELTEWTKQHKGDLRAIHVLFRSRIIAMGVAVGNLATGGVTTTHTDRAEWERLLLTVLRSRE